MFNWSLFFLSLFLIRCFSFDLHHYYHHRCYFGWKWNVDRNICILVWLKCSGQSVYLSILYRSHNFSLHLMKEKKKKKRKAKRLLDRSFIHFQIWIMKRATIYLEQINFVCQNCELVVTIPGPWSHIIVSFLFMHKYYLKKVRVEYPPAVWNGATYIIPCDLNENNFQTKKFIYRSLVRFSFVHCY